MKSGQGARQGAGSRARSKSSPILQLLAGAPPAAAGSAPLSLDMRISNFGPIKRGAIALRPLTVFIGPSNTGKSYAATLAHSIISSVRGAARRRSATAGMPSQKAALGRLSKDMRNMLLALEPEEAAKCPPAMAARIARMCRHGLCASLEREIESNFASPLRGMVRRNAGRFSVTLESGGRRVMAYGGGRMALGSAPKIDIVFQPTEADDGTGYLRVTDPDDRTIHCRVDRGLISSEIGPSVSRRLYELIEEKMMPRMIPGLPAADFYLPAARTGILQAHREISSAIVKSAPYGGTEDIQAPRLSGVVSDFVSSMIEMRPVRGPYFDMGSRMESDMLGGRVDLRYDGQHTFPELVYRQRDGGVPVHRASSTVSGLAPLTLLLKHRIVRGSMLVVEEPEAHLHPGDQLRLAGHVARLVRSGINVLITTHSATLFEAIGQYLEASAMPPESRKRALGADDLYVRADEIAPHLFSPGRGGSTAEKIAVSARDGVSQDEFIRADQLLSENNARIEECSG